MENRPGLAAACRDVLLLGAPQAKLMAARKLRRDWMHGRLEWRFDVAMPDRPGRPERPELLPAHHMPRRGKGTSIAARIALLHALAHIEFVAIDLAIDMVGRFGAAFPRHFVDDWLAVAADEAMHFALLDRRLVQLGSHYGALPAHDGLWEAASNTAHDVAARLAVVPMVLEARGLDVTPATIDRLNQNGDIVSARILQRIFTDEIRHVRFGTQWFETVCQAVNADPVIRWRELVKSHFPGAIKPPFNDSARSTAGLTCDFYHGLAS